MLKKLRARFLALLKKYRYIYTLLYWILLEGYFFYKTGRVNLWLMPVNLLIAVGIAWAVSWTVDRMLEEAK